MKYKHKTLFIVIIWLALSFLYTSALPWHTNPEQLAVIINITGPICLAYLTLSKGVEVKKALNAPRGEYGAPYVPARKSKHFFITLFFVALSLEVFIFSLILRIDLSTALNNVLIFAGMLSAAFVGVTKFTSLAAQSGPPKSAPSQEATEGGL